jgi:hypothetical protein
MSPILCHIAHECHARFRGYERHKYKDSTDPVDQALSYYSLFGEILSTY